MKRSPAIGSPSRETASTPKVEPRRLDPLVVLDAGTPRENAGEPADGVSPGTGRHHSSMFRGVEALIVLLKAHRSLGITQLASALGLSKSTAHDLVAALCELGFVEQNTTTRRYSISPEIFRFLHLFSSDYGSNSALKPLVRAFAAKLKASVVVTALCRLRTYALCASGPNADTFLLGDHGPPCTSACGKILVAQLPESRWSDYAPQACDRPQTPFSNLDPKRFHAELRAAAGTGVAWSLRERDPELCSVAAPLRVGDPPWDRAVGLALPYREWMVRDRAELAQQVTALAAEITAHLQRKATGLAGRSGETLFFLKP